MKRIIKMKGMRKEATATTTAEKRINERQDLSRLFK